MLRRRINLLAALAAAAAIAALLPAHALSAGERMAWVLSVDGAVELRRAGSPPKAFEPLTQPDQDLFSGDAIRTGADGRAIVQFADGSRLYCFEEAELEISEGERTRTVLGVEAERYLSRLVDVGRGAIGLAVEPNEQLTTEVQSPTSVVGVRGTVIDPFRVDAVTGETLVGLKKGLAWGYTPDGEAAFEMVPGILARMGKDASGRPTVRSAAGLIGLLTRDHKIKIDKGQGVFLDLKTARGTAVIGSLPESVGRVVVEAGGNRAELAPRQSLKTLVDRKAGRLTMEAVEGRLSLSDKLGKRRVLVPGKPAELEFTPPALEPRLIPGLKPRSWIPPGAPELPGVPPAAKGVGRKLPALKTDSVEELIKPPASARKALPQLPKPEASPNPLKRLFEKALPLKKNLTSPPKESPGAEAPAALPSLEDLSREQAASPKPTPVPKKTPLRSPFPLRKFRP